MPKRTDLKKILVIGSGPIVIGQAAEFDYAGTQACLALKEEGYEVVLCNSNPATIMTDTSIADKVYMEPLTLEYIAKIIRYERPDAIIPGIGGQTGLNLAMQLEKKGVLKECRVELLGTSSESIERAEDRELFKELCQSIGEPVIPSEITYNLDEAKAAAQHIGYPVVLRPAFTLGGTGSLRNRRWYCLHSGYGEQQRTVCGWQTGGKCFAVGLHIGRRRQRCGAGTQTVGRCTETPVAAGCMFGF